MPQFNLSKFKNKHFLSLVGNGVISLFGLLLFGLVYKTLPGDDVGTWLFFMATLSVLDSIRNGLLGTAMVKFYAGADDTRAKNVLGSVWYLAVAVTGLMVALNALAFLALPLLHNEPTIVSIKWVGITLISSLPFSVIFWKLQADEQYGTMLWMRMLNSGSTILAYVVLIWMGNFNLRTALQWNFITNCLTSIIGMLANLGGIRAVAHRSRASVTEILHFGKYSLATNLSSNLLRTVDTYIVTFMLGPGAVAVLSLPAKLMELVEIPLRSFVGTGMSSMATAFNQKNMHQVTYILKKYSSMLTFAFIPLTIAVFFLADIPINLLSSGKYKGTEAANIYRFVMCTALMYPIDRFTGVTLDIIHQPKINFKKVQLMLVMKIVGDVVFISLLGNLYGAPLAGFFTTLAGLLYGCMRLQKFMPFTIGGILKTGFQGLRQLAARKNA